MIPTLAQICSLPSSMERDVEDYAAGACHSLEIWCGKLDAFLERHSPDDLRELLARHAMTAPVASFQGGLFASQGAARQEHWSLFARRLDQLRSVGVATLVLAADIGGPLDWQLLDRVGASLRLAAEHAGNAGLRLALEFQARSAFANNLETAAALVAETASPHLGICLDAFQFYVGSSKTEDLAFLSRENLFHVQLSDLAGTARELAIDGDRILPGDGDLPLESIVSRLRQIHYAGPVSVELMNPQLWQVPPRQFGEVAITSLRKLLGQASMD